MRIWSWISVCFSSDLVFARQSDGHAVGTEFVGDLRKPAVDLLRVLGGNDSARAEHRGVRAAGGDIFFPQTLVDGDRRVNLLHDRRGSATEAAAPHAEIGRASCRARLCQVV